MQDKEFSDADIQQLKSNFDQVIGFGRKAVAAIEIVEKASVMHYSESLSRFMKVFVHLPTHVAKAR